MRRAVRRSIHRQRSGVEPLEQRLVLGSLSVADQLVRAGIPQVDAVGEPASAPDVLPIDTSGGTERVRSKADDSSRDVAVPPSREEVETTSQRADEREAGDAEEESETLLPAVFASALSEGFDDGEPVPEVPAPPSAPSRSGKPRATGLITGSGKVQPPGSGLRAASVTSHLLGANNQSTSNQSVDAPAAGSTPAGEESSPGGGGATTPAADGPWFAQGAGSVQVGYDFRDLHGHANRITDAQIASAHEAMAAWTYATAGAVEFVHDPHSPAEEIMVVGTGDLAAVGAESGRNGVLAMGAGAAPVGAAYPVSGVAWMDHAELWDTTYGEDGTSRFDFFTVTAHEIGHVLGYGDSYDYSGPNIMLGSYGGSATFDAVANVVDTQKPVVNLGSELDYSPMMSAQLKASEVETILTRASTLTASDDAIISVVDRNGRILGVRVEAGVADAGGGAPSDELLSFMIDGSLAKARTAAFFANGDPTNGDREGTLAPLTSRTVRFVSQSTVTQREVESNPSESDLTRRGPGFVAPIGLGGHFPPETNHTPHVDLFAIEHTNRDRFDHTRAGGRTKNRFNAPFDTNAKRVFAPKSYGQVTRIAPQQKPRGIGTLPGGVPIYADTNLDGVGDTLVGGVGVFFPGPDGFATHEQGFIAGVGQTEKQRTNAPKVLEAELMAAVAAGGSVLGAAASNRPILAQTGDRFDIPFSEGLTLVGINLEVIGPTASDKGLRQLVKFGEDLAVATSTPLGTAADSGVNVPVRRNGVTTSIDGRRVPQFDLVSPRDAASGTLTKEDVRKIFDQADAAARRVRAAIRLEVIDATIDSTQDIRAGVSQTRMVFAVTDLEGNVIGLHRMQDATVFSIDVAVAKARNVTYYAGAGIHARDQVSGIPTGTAFTNRTFRFLAEPRFPSGVDGSIPPPFSILNNPFIDAKTGENIGAPRSFKKYRDTVLGYDAFVPGSNFRDSGTLRKNQNGIVFFPGSVPLYKDGVLVGGLGISGDGVDQDDVVTFLGAKGFLPYNVVPVADEFTLNRVRLPFIKFLRNPFLD